MRIAKSLTVFVATFVVASVSFCQTILGPVFGGNDNGAIQTFNVTNSLAAGAVIPAGCLGNSVDVSAFENATIWLSSTNPYTAPATNVFKLMRGIGTNATAFETTGYRTCTVIVPGQTNVFWMTNLVAADMGGFGYLKIGSLTNTSAAVIDTNLDIGFISTNNQLQIGVSTKVLHSLR